MAEGVLKTKKLIMTEMIREEFYLGYGQVEEFQFRGMADGVINEDRNSS